MDLHFRLIEPDDDPRVAAIIKTVMTEYGCVGSGYSIEDAEVNEMYKTYTMPGSVYYVIESNGIVYGGAGIGPLVGGQAHICEMKKMYFLSDIRGNGAGGKLIDLLLDEAKSLGYTVCYLETVARMKTANHLYAKHGFKKQDGNSGNTGHGGCDTFYSKELV